MARIDLVQSQHASVKRDYRQRVMDHDKAECAIVARRFEEDYWDGDRRYGYGGYRYDGRWRPLAETLAERYALKAGERLLDVGCGKAFLLYELSQVVPGLEVFGLDISQWGLSHARPEMQGALVRGDARALPFADESFDCVISLGTLHNLGIEHVGAALGEMQRVCPGPRKYFMVESWRNEAEKANLLYWQLTCMSFHTPEGWAFLADQAGYVGDHGFIFFE
jgi:SAM-dependent methyltransferase